MTKTYKEYEEAPSGSVFFYNYKEPLMTFDEGFGFKGALVYDDTSGKVQCHFCGGWYDALSYHLKREHNMKAADYKSKVGLNVSSALISETFREKLVASGNDHRLQNLRKVNKSKRRKPRTGASAERKNNTNTCPEQLLKRLTDLHNKLGRTPRYSEVTFIESLKNVYGTLENALKIAGLPPPRGSGDHLTKDLNRKWTREAIIGWMEGFYAEHKKLPTTREIPKGITSCFDRKTYDKKELWKAALLRDGQYKKVTMTFSYTEAELITFMRMFKKIHDRLPSQSDTRRGLLPSMSRYVTKFGSWKEALSVAFK